MADMHAPNRNWRGSVTSRPSTVVHHGGVGFVGRHGNHGGGRRRRDKRRPLFPAPWLVFWMVPRQGTRLVLPRPKPSHMVRAVLCCERVAGGSHYPASLAHVSKKKKKKASLAHADPAHVTALATDARSHSFSEPPRTCRARAPR
jgi:hypothetical protein